MSDLNDKFHWGMVINDHTIGPYTIREYHPRKARSNTLLNEVDTGLVKYHGYIDGMDLRESWNTLEDAMAGIIVHRIVGHNASQINYHFIAGLRAMVRRD